MIYKVSIAMCTFNGSKYIGDQLNSIVKQTQKPYEIVICDDVSTDNTLEIIRSILNKTEIKWSININKTRLGVAKNFEKAIEICTGDIIFTADQDDIWVKNKVEKMVNEFEKDQEVNLIFSNAKLVDSNLKKLPGDLWETINFSNKKIKKNRKVVLEYILKHNFVTGATMAFKKDLLKKIIPIPEHWIHDYWIAVQCLIDGKILAIPEMLVLYRQHGQNVIGAKKISIANKMGKYVRNFKRVDEIHNQKSIMIKELENNLESRHKEIDINIMETVKECNRFWNKRTNQLNGSKILTLQDILKDTLNYNYKKYYTGIRGAIRDIFVVISG